MSVILAIIGHIGWATGDVLTTLVARRIKALATSFWIYSVLMVVFLCVSFLFFDELELLTFKSVSLNVGLAVLLFFTYLSFVKGLQIGNAPLVAAISGAFPALVVVLSIVFFNETLSLTQVAIIVMIIIGIVLSSIDIKNLRRKGLQFDLATMLSLAAFLGWGVYFTFIRVPLETYGWFWTTFISNAVGLLAAFAVAHKVISATQLKKTASFIPITIGGILVGGGTLAINAAIEIGKSSIVAPIAGSAAATFALLAYIIFKERLSRQQELGVIVTIGSVITLSIISS